MFSASALALLTFVHVAASEFMDEQTVATIDAEMQGLVDQSRVSGIDAVREIVNLRSKHDPDHLGAYVLASPSGRVLAGNLVAWPDIPPDANGVYRFRLRELGDHPGPSQEVMARGAELGGGFRLLVGRDIEQKHRTQELIRNAIVMGVGMMLIIGIAGGFAISRWTIGRLELINRTTSAIIAGNLGRRIAMEGGGDEFDELAQNLNAMLERIEKLLAGMREVTDNVAHDLRTPLSRMRSRLEVALMHEVDSDETRELLEATMRDADGLIATFNALLSIARAEAGSRTAEWEEIDLTQAVHDVAELYEPLAEEKEIALSIDAREPVLVQGHPQLLAQAIANLVDNAIKYTPQGGKVALSTGNQPQPFVRVVDNGPGIPPEQRQRALERFVRLQPERTTPGNGLGLSLVSAVASLHGATLELGDAEPGLQVTLRIPALKLDRRLATQPLVNSPA